jgi:hypothetical protein
MEVSSEGEIKAADEPTTLDFPIYPGVPPPSPESCVHDQTPAGPSPLRLWRELDLPEVHAAGTAVAGSNRLLMNPGPAC